MKKFKKLTSLFRGLAAVFAVLVTLLAAAYPITQIPEVKSNIDGIFNVDRRIIKDSESSAAYEVKGYMLCSVGFPAEATPVLKPKPPIEHAPVYEEREKVEWEYALEGLTIGFGVLTGLLGAAWLVAEFLPVKKEEN